MIVRVFDAPKSVMVMMPVYPEALDKDTKENGWENIPHFDCNSSELPLSQDPITKECFECSWICDMENKKVVIKQPRDCIHNKLMVLDKILDDPLAFRQDKLNALLDRELLIRSNRGK